MTLRKSEQAIRNAQERVERRLKEEEKQRKASGIIKGAAADEPHAQVDDLEQQAEVFDGTLEELEGDVKEAFGQAPAKDSKGWADNAMASLGQTQGEANEPEAGDD